MKKVSEEVDDWLRPEYKRSELGELVRGKYSATQVEFAEVVKLSITCVVEDAKLQLRNSLSQYRKDLIRVVDLVSPITSFASSAIISLRMMLEVVQELISNPLCIMTSEAGAELLSSLEKHVRLLSDRVNDLKDHS